ncbi:STE like transcription factor [Nakaseomyces glabratus]|nr:STE like transcription factor [Nakaseomyces glabratus]KAH7600691.1 STE like transcription factor [Nakaseomyces glabratus]KAH7613129.1 STE like transcription factor [Nakaseomyces glabratus]
MMASDDRAVIGNALKSIDELTYFLATAPVNWQPGQVIRRYFLNEELGYISCVFWDNIFYITGTDIIKICIYKMLLFGRVVLQKKKFEEGIFSDLRCLKIGEHASLEQPKSPFLDFLYKNMCVKTQKKQKVFYWFSVPHDKLISDALERDLKRESNGMNQLITTRAVREPALTFKYNRSIAGSVFQQARNYFVLRSRIIFSDVFSTPIDVNRVPNSNQCVTGNANDLGVNLSSSQDTVETSSQKYAASNQSYSSVHTPIPSSDTTPHTQHADLRNMKPSNDRAVSKTSQVPPKDNETVNISKQQFMPALIDPTTGFFEGVQYYISNMGSKEYMCKQRNTPAVNLNADIKQSSPDNLIEKEEDPHASIQVEGPLRCSCGYSARNTGRSTASSSSSDNSALQSTDDGSDPGILQSRPPPPPSPPPPQFKPEQDSDRGSPTNSASRMDTQVEQKDSFHEYTTSSNEETIRSGVSVAHTQRSGSQFDDGLASAETYDKDDYNIAGRTSGSDHDDYDNHSIESALDIVLPAGTEGNTSSMISTDDEFYSTFMEPFDASKYFLSPMDRMRSGFLISPQSMQPDITFAQDEEQKSQHQLQQHQQPNTHPPQLQHQFQHQRRPRTLRQGKYLKKSIR